MDKHQPSDNPNSRNGSSRKTLRTENGQFELDTPRDRDGSFEPKLVKNGQIRFTSMDDKSKRLTNPTLVSQPGFH